jgi:geranylgeranyl transferase type-1 subunit beta
MSMLYFCLVALDLLGALENVDVKRKRTIVDWIYNCQIPPESAYSWRYCGFKGGSYNGQPFRSDGSEVKAEYPTHQHDMAHIAMTYTALAALVTLGDDLSRVEKTAIVRALAALQQPDGSFAATATVCDPAAAGGGEKCEAETSNSFGSVGGGGETDMRFLYCACAISAMLGDWSGVDEEAACRFVRACVGFDGGVGLVASQESHGGSTFTAVAALSLMRRLRRVEEGANGEEKKTRKGEKGLRHP